ncbi:MAG TPA: phosphatidate cytidylyltransferase [Humidesulfovibrio sp.]|uniref:phosphatidate cytidylyltransferase n=1 Tax=Humidesulfovibrio sp. TaxID=2910988 RepID=UPI002CBB374F|nr:phosphatidate cytidylyltransferase [Humidesulfovibrio sp.]HWR02383.1 phosphatidate cytidylyltransferase [Humidesulfovibrio sp.]
MPASAHQQRILTAGLAVGLVALALWQGGIFVLAVLACVCALGQWEFTAMFRPGPEHKNLRMTGVALGAAMLLAAKLGGPQAALWVLVATFWFLALRFLFRYSADQQNTDFFDELILMGGVFYLPLMLQFCLGLSTPEIILVLLSTAVSDTAAYYSGTFFGKARIWPQVSPKKSWAGSIGGFTGCVAAVTVYGAFLGEAPLPAWILLGAALNIGAQMGDFFESALKRRLQVKDSSTLLPGHGGVLDRIDSLLLALPCYALFKQAVPFFP